MPASVFTPFFRRFADEKSLELKETEDLYQRVAAQHRPYADDDALYKLAHRLLGEIEEAIPDDLREAFFVTICLLLSCEEAIFTLPEFRPSLSLKEMVELRDALRRKEHFHLNHDRVLGLLKAGILGVLEPVAEVLPKTETPSPFTIPLAYALPEPKRLIDNIYSVFWRDEYRETAFVEVSRRLHYNLCSASGIADPHNPRKPFIMPSKHAGTLSETVEAYLSATPFEELFEASVPLQLTHETRFSHMHVVGGSGAGKTQLLQSLILHDLNSDDAPGMVIIDSQGDLIDKISHLAIDGLAERLVLITPKDIDHPPALNIFDVSRRLGTYDAVTREQVTAGAIETFDYLFTGLLGADLTAKQGIFFRYVARLMLALPETLGRNATILDMMALMEDPEPYDAAIQSLPDIQRQFFLRDFTAPRGKRGTFDQTKEQIRYRLQGILENPTLYRLFTAPETKIDLFEELNQGSIVLVDTAKDFLKGSSSHFGRIFISLVLQAVLERAVIPESERRPTFLVVDEAADYFDSNIDDLLTESRKYRLGCVFAHQHLDQCAPSLRASFAANTAIKMAAGVSMSDARAMAPDMRTTSEFILSQPRLHFACHIRNVTPQAVSIPVEAGKLEREPRLSQDAYERFRADNRERVSLGREAHVRAPQAATPQAKPTPVRDAEEKSARPRPAASNRPAPREKPTPKPPPSDADDDYRL